AAAVDELIRRVISRYTALGICLLALGYVGFRSPLPGIDAEHESDEGAPVNCNRKSICEFRHMILGAVAIFLHVGTQVIAIDTIIAYANSLGITLLEAKTFPSYTLFFTIVGYCIGIITIPKLISQ